MARITIFGVLSNIQILVHTALFGTCIGADTLGNKYYTGKPRRGTKLQRRWVMYAGKTEASMVPPEWHGWLHHQTDVIPSAINPYRKDWIKPHQPNMTGTPEAYMPPVLKGKPRAAATGDYVSWTPPQ